MMERNSHKKFWFAIAILAIVAIASLVATVWVLNEMEPMQAELTAVEIELNASKVLVESLEDTLSNLQVNYDRLTTGYGYVLRDPSYQEMEDFLKQDETSE